MAIQQTYYEVSTGAKVHQDDEIKNIRLIVCLSLI